MHYCSRLDFFLFTEGHPDASKQAEAIKKARVGYINLKAYLNQVDCIEFATALRNEFLFAVGSAEGFGPWLDQAEERIKVKPVMVFYESLCIYQYQIASCFNLSQVCTKALE